MKVVILCIFTFLNQFLIGDYRDIYISQDEFRVTDAYQHLSEQKQITDDELCYKAVFECMYADYLVNPYQKFNHFINGYALLNNLIEKHPRNPEYRYHRYMIEEHAPAWLIENNKGYDKQFVITQITKSHPMYDFIMKTINN